MPTLASPKAFDLCEGGQCGDPKVETDGKHVSCSPNDNCSTGNCYCQLFQRRKGAAETDPWNASAIDHTKLSKHRPDKQDYRCFCVKPILEGETTIDGVTYAFRYLLCGSGTCGLDTVEVIAGDPPKKHYEVKCSGKCEGECKCTLFRLQTAGGGAPFDPRDAKWELAAKAGKQVLLEDHFVYRCFCLK